jgi:K+-sensing histidine kinase KdpD
MANEEPTSGHAATAVWEQHHHRVELLAATAREMQTPLALVLGFGKLLATRECSSERIRDAADEIQRGAKRMAVLLNELLAAAGLMPLPEPAEARASPEDPSAEIDGLVERLGAAEQRSAALTAELAEARLAQRQLESYADDFRRTYAEARRLLQQMTALYEVSRSIGATVDPSEVLIRTTEGLRRLLPSDGVAIYLLDKDRRVARRQAVAFPDGLAEPPMTAARDRGPLGRSLAQGQMVLEGPRPSAVERRNPAWTVALPLLAGSRQLGALMLVRPGSQPFSEEERHLAEMVASQTAMAVQNARLAATDGLTGLYNRRYFEQALALGAPEGC